MIKMTLSDVAQQLDSAIITQDAEFTGISKDTRSLTIGNLYVAIVGEQFDGHNFVEEAFKKNASAALVSRKIDCPIPQIIVKDTIEALGKIGAFWRNRFSIPFIGVTGSNGKTTLKNMIASILRAHTKHDNQVLATEGNLNNNIGVPLMLSRLSPEHRYAVIEMGMNHFNEIAYLTKLVQPKVAVVNNAAAAHLEALGDVSGVARAKGEIFLGLTKDGTAILNQDDTYFNYWRDLTQGHDYLSFGLQHASDVTASLSTTDEIILQTPKGKVALTLPLLGRHNVMNALAATAATLPLGVSLEAIKQGLENVKPAPGRLRQQVLKSGVKIIDDTYNANPASVNAAINTLATLAGTKILILGDMKELGANARQLHFEIGQKALDAGIHYLFTFGDLSNAATQAFGNNALHFTDRDELITKLNPLITNGTNILIKGSRSMKMELIVAKIIPQNEQNETEHLH